LICIHCADWDLCIFKTIYSVREIKDSLDRLRISSIFEGVVLSFFYKIIGKIW